MKATKITLETSNKLCDANWLTDGKPSKELYRIPDLAELIEACGEKFGLVGRDPLMRHGKLWFVCAYSDLFGARLAGDTPEEAVANLWLSLQDNK